MALIENPMYDVSSGTDKHTPDTPVGELISTQTTIIEDTPKSEFVIDSYEEIDNGGGLGFMICACLPCILVLFIVSATVPKAGPAAIAGGLVCFWVIFLYVIMFSSVQELPMYKRLQSLEMSIRKSEQNGSTPLQQLKEYAHRIKHEVPRVYFVVDCYHHEKHREDDNSAEIGENRRGRSRPKTVTIKVSSSIEQRNLTGYIAEDCTVWDDQQLSNLEVNTEDYKFLAIDSSFEMIYNERDRLDAIMNRLVEENKHKDKFCTVTLHAELPSLVEYRLLATKTLSREEARYFSTTMFVWYVLSLRGMFYAPGFNNRTAKVQMNFKKKISLVDVEAQC